MELFGIGEVYHSRIASYSKGMRQKLLIISSLLHNPDLLFFDEPINGLDANSVMIFKEIMTQLARTRKNDLLLFSYYGCGRKNKQPHYSPE